MLEIITTPILWALGMGYESGGIASALAGLSTRILITIGIWGFFLLGLATFFSVILRFMRLFYRHFVRRQFNLRKRYGPNSWACISSSSAGIGNAFAKILALQGFNLILLDKDGDRLMVTLNVIKALNEKIQVKGIVADFDNTDPEFLQNIMNQVNKCVVSLLVNSYTYDYKEDFLNTSGVYRNSKVEPDFSPYTLLTLQIAEKMITRADKSGIINVSNVEAKYLNAAGIRKLTESLSHGISKRFNNKIDVLSLLLGSNVLNAHSSNFSDTNYEEILRHALRDLGHEEYSFGGWRNDFNELLMSISTFYLFDIFRRKNDPTTKDNQSSLKDSSSIKKRLTAVDGAFFLTKKANMNSKEGETRLPIESILK